MILTAQAFPVPLSSHLCTTDVAPLKKQIIILIQTCKNSILYTPTPK